MAYCVRADIENLFGVKTVAQMADLEGHEDDVHIAARIAAAIVYAEAEVDDVLRGGPYVVPVADAEDAVPACITKATAQMAGVWLYESKGVTDWNPETGTPTHKYSYQRGDARRVLTKIRIGARNIDAVRVECSMVPHNVEESE